MVRKYLHQARKGGILLLASAIAISISAYAQTASDGGQAQQATASIGYDDRELIQLLEKEASRRVSALVQSKGTLRTVDVRVTIDPGSRRILADIGEGYRPGPDADEMFLQELIVTLRHYSERVGLRIDGVDLNFQGKPLEYYYPEELRVPTPGRTNPNNRSAFVSARHGLVRVHPRTGMKQPPPEGWRSTITSRSRRIDHWPRTSSATCRKSYVRSRDTRTFRYMRMHVTDDTAKTASAQCPLSWSKSPITQTPRTLRHCRTRYSARRP